MYNRRVYPPARILWDQSTTIYVFAGWLFNYNFSLHKETIYKLELKTSDNTLSYIISCDNYFIVDKSNCREILQSLFGRNNSTTNLRIREGGELIKYSSVKLDWIRRHLQPRFCFLCLHSDTQFVCSMADSVNIGLSSWLNVVFNIFYFGKCFLTFDLSGAFFYLCQLIDVLLKTFRLFKCFINSCC